MPHIRGRIAPFGYNDSQELCAGPEKGLHPRNLDL